MRAVGTGAPWERLDEGGEMGIVQASITVSVDGFVTGPEPRPGCGLGVGGERLHYWVFGGPWRYDTPRRGEATGEDRAWLETHLATNGAVVCGRGTYEDAGHWGDANPWGIPVFVVTHRPEEQPPGDAFTFVDGVAEAIALAGDAAGARNAHVMGGAQVIRQALAAGLVDELSLVVAPLTMGAGTRLFDGFTDSIELEHLGVRQSPFATFVDYRVRR